jgi:predicted aldo/keto reductase-like oxidoreductase
VLLQYKANLLPNKGVYIYQPAKPGKSANEPPKKRRKVSSTGAQDRKPDSQRFVPLLNGEESAEGVQQRLNTYKQLWSEQEQKIQVGIQQQGCMEYTCSQFLLRESWKMKMQEF